MQAERISSLLETVTDTWKWGGGRLTGGNPEVALPLAPAMRYVGPSSAAGSRACGQQDPCPRGSLSQPWRRGTGTHTALPSRTLLRHM